MTQDLQDDLVFISRDDVDGTRREGERAWSDLLAEASLWPTIAFDEP